jgi:D-glycero-D-manno-heptose 1,7-bisphosphate phosphatase
MPRAHKAAFLDRDGTIIEEKHYIANPDDVVLTDGAVAGLRTLQRAGFKLVVVTNQSGIARGLYTAADFLAVQQRLHELLAGEGVELDAVYHCPHHPDFTGPCDCRKPGPGMYRQAERNLDIDLARSVYIGDRAKDVLPAALFGGLGILVATGYGTEEADPLPAGALRAANLEAAAELAKSRRGA